MTGKIIGLSGKKRHGKDTTGGIIETLRPNVVRIAYADALKREVAEMIVSYVEKNPKQWAGGVIYDEKLIQHYVDLMNNDQIDPETGVAYKEQFRLVLQWWGTEFRRKLFGDDYWRKRLEDKLKGLDPEAIAVITDVRFPDEANQIKMLGGVMVRINRPGMPPSGTHESETALDNYASFDYHLNNDGPEFDYLTSLTPQVEKFLQTYGY